MPGVFCVGVLGAMVWQFDASVCWAVRVNTVDRVLIVTLISWCGVRAHLVVGWWAGLSSCLSGGLGCVCGLLS